MQVVTQVSKIAHLKRGSDVDLSDTRDLEFMQVRAIDAREAAPVAYTDELSALMCNWVSQSVYSARQID